MTHLARRSLFRGALAASAIAVLTSSAFAQEVRLDVPYVPTSQATVDEMLRMANVTAKDYVVDLGSGDGRIVISAAKLGATAMGVDINPQRIKESHENAKAAGVTDKVKFFQQDLFQTKFSDATVLTMYLLPSVNLRLRPTILNEMKPGTRVVSHDFDMGDWKPDQQKDLGSDQVYFWIVPAKVEGSWTAKIGDDSYKLDLTQRFQEVTGSASAAGKSAKVENGRLAGETFTFELVDGANRRTLSGKVSGNSISGQGWSATKG
ncbi:MAG: class I SAM-dependent methyltransferase [Alphaproteobacteria bacterium]